MQSVEPRGIHRRLPIDPAPELIARIKCRCEQGENGCVNWTGAQGGKGHGRINFAGRLYSPHCVMYVAKHGCIPDGKIICHTCDNPRCVNPDHLFAGTYRDNVLDMVRKGRNSKACGEEHKLATHTNEDAIAVRVQWLQGKSQRTIVKELGLLKAFVQKVLSGEIWSHVETLKAEVDAKRATNPFSIARRRRSSGGVSE